MKVWSVYTRGEYDWEAIKDGFCWPGFILGALGGILGAIWAWSMGLVGIGFAVLGLSFVILVLGKMGNVAMAGLAVLLWLGMATVLGVKGNEWRRKTMARQGFDLLASGIEASKKTEALQIAKTRVAQEASPSQVFSAPLEMRENPDGTFNVGSRTFRKKVDAEAYIDLVKRQSRLA